ncbi:MAG TPA: polyphosphate kinase 2 family protein [Candidatus Limnocylindria bacterium]|nr:polyphosphate kinase 2 family protein [Candidatus Limnocylindria bacterium]
MNFVKKLRADGKHFRLKDHDPKYHGDLSRETAEEMRARQLVELQELQDRLYAANSQSVLMILQGMDASGKDGVVKHVMSGVNPAGCEITSFKAPSPLELSHDYLWRSHQKAPMRGRIGIFNRSHYEEVLVVRVHPEILLKQRLPPGSLKEPKIWERRYREIRDFERQLHDNGTRVIKCFLHMSPEEQLDRFLQRIDDPARNWKFEPGDVAEREHWHEYQAAFEEMIQHTSTDEAPWYVIPADRKWFSRIAVGGILLETLQDIDPKYPETTDKHRQELKKIRKRLLAGGKRPKG